MIGFNTPHDFPSDGCTWPTLLNDLLGRDRYKNICRRHDFECRFGTHHWTDARDHMIEGVKEESPWWLYWRVPLIWAGLTLGRKQCSEYTQPLPDKWAKWADRSYSQL